MRRLELRVESRRRFKVTTDSNHNHPVAPNHLNREFQVDTPDTVWASDITYIWTCQGWLYLAVVLDPFSRKVVGWSLQATMTADWVKEAWPWRLAIVIRLPGFSITRTEAVNMQAKPTGWNWKNAA